MLEPGTVKELTVVREAPFGYFLTNGEEDVLLHHSEVPENFHPEEKQTVFLYQDHEGRLSASLTIPQIRKGQYGWAEVVEVKAGLGVFVHIGLQKDLLISKDDLPELLQLWPEKGDKLYCSMKTDKKNRLFGELANEEVMRGLSVRAGQSVFNKSVKGTVYRVLLSGSLIITEERYIGFIHQSERKEEPRLGQHVEGRVVAVKEDGTINVSLLPRAHEMIDEQAEQIYRYLQGRGGSMPYSDKSEAEDIKKRFSISKGLFKKVLGKLMKEGKVIQKDGWTHITDQDSRHES
ncbi:putative RNA-binding protein (virulence factor B family) [Bacillus thermophilus]|uniref:RNA-binding protein (Virulence factor B family) n=1 Tax=Siminovitchia thermophila TaxID=1245522 RepID=A0ABS2RAR5_9BACI|nr:S1-like domain-containing RNA-binding protein [Siminovitchia thermophila]MBM7716742.1 putative RNA-binding protein (virulence factor B family) [Siminovitchia thermophila]